MMINQLFPYPYVYGLLLCKQNLFCNVVTKKKKSPKTTNSNKKRMMGSDLSCFPRHEMSFQAERTLAEVKVEAVCKHLAALSKAGKQDDVILVPRVTGIPQ